jgi:hypothetical protein
VEAEQRVFEDRNRERAGVDARRGELIGAAEQAIRASLSLSLTKGQPA